MPPTATSKGSGRTRGKLRQDPHALVANQVVITLYSTDNLEFANSPAFQEAYFICQLRQFRRNGTEGSSIVTAATRLDLRYTVTSPRCQLVRDHLCAWVQVEM